MGCHYSRCAQHIVETDLRCTETLPLPNQLIHLTAKVSSLSLGILVHGTAFSFCVAGWLVHSTRVCVFYASDKWERGETAVLVFVNSLSQPLHPVHGMI